MGVPTANDIAIVTTAGVAKGFTLTGSDVQGRAMTLSLFSAPANGTISGSGVNLIYTPRAGFSGLDSFTYRAVINGTAVASEPSVIYVFVR